MMNVNVEEERVDEQVDERLQEALAVLFEQFWVLRSEEPLVYQLLRQQEHKLKRYLNEKFGFDLIVHQYFIKLEKIPVDPKAWMGIQAFTDKLDYSLFCCGLAFTEERSVDEQFLLSDIAEDIAEMYPGEFTLDWTNYQHRKSLIRALNKLVELRLIRSVDGDVEQFAFHEDAEVLYEVSIYARYFMRSYPDDLFQFDSIENILQAEWDRNQTDYRRKRVYRKLMFSPVVYRESDDDADFAYIRQFRNRLRDDFESHTPMKLDVFKNAAMLVMPERKQRYTLFPDQKAITDIMLHLAAAVRSKREKLSINEHGEIRCSYHEFERWVEELQADVGHGWSKQYRESPAKTISQELIDALTGWEFAREEQDTGIIVLMSGFGRMIGGYPDDYLKGREER